MKHRIQRIAAKPKAVISVCILLVLLVIIFFVSMSTGKIERAKVAEVTEIDTTKPVSIQDTKIDNAYFSMDVPEVFVNQVSYGIQLEDGHLYVCFYLESYEDEETGILAGIKSVHITDYDVYGLTKDIGSTGIEEVWNQYVEQYAIGGEKQLVDVSEDKTCAYEYWYPTDVQWSLENEEKEELYFDLRKKLDTAITTFQVKEQIEEQSKISMFLNLYYTSDRNARYSDVSTDIVQSIEYFYHDLEGFVTQECLKDLKAKRLPWSYDKRLAEGGAEAWVNKILIENGEKGNYQYQVEIGVKRGGVIHSVEASGQIIIDEDTGLISMLYETTMPNYEKEFSFEEELTMDKVIAMFKDGSVGTADYFSFTNAKVEDKEEAKKNGWLNYYVNYDLLYQDEPYRLGASYRVEDDTLEDVYLTRESDMESVLIYTTTPRYAVVKDIEVFMNSKIQFSDIVSIELPEGYTLSDYNANYGIHGGVLIEPLAYEIKGDSAASNVPAEWIASGTISVIKDAGNWFLFEDGKIVEKQMGYWNHTSEEKIESLEGLAMPEILYHGNHDLYTAAEMENLLEQGIELSEDELTSDFWYIYFASPDKEEAYYLSLDQRQFTKEQAIAIAKTVDFRIY